MRENASFASRSRPDYKRNVDEFLGRGSYFSCVPVREPFYTVSSVGECSDLLRV